VNGKNMVQGFRVYFLQALYLLSRLWHGESHAKSAGIIDVQFVAGLPSECITAVKYVIVVVCIKMRRLGSFNSSFSCL